MHYSVSEVARRTGVTVRTLHHYDEVGLLVPERDASGFRTYDDADLDRLAEILTYRALGIGLDEIGGLVDGEAEPASVLKRRRDLVRHQMDRLGRVLEELDDRLEGAAMAPERIKEVFDGFDPDAYAAEAEERWGDTDAWAESQRRTGKYTEEDWRAIKAEGEDIGDRFGTMVDAGTDPTSAEAMDLAEEHRRHISRWYYECTAEIHNGLGEMYVADARFTAYWEAFGEGTAQFVSTAITANALR